MQTTHNLSFFLSPDLDANITPNQNALQQIFSWMTANSNRKRLN